MSEPQLAATGPTPKLSTCVVIGGGLSGLIAATVLQRQNIPVTVLDKGRGIGGRLATRRVHHTDDHVGVFDYGAQFLQASDPRLQNWIENWLRAGIITQWHQGSWPGQNQSLTDTYYRGVKSNRDIAKYLAHDLDVHTSTRVSRVVWQESYWQIETQSGHAWQADVLLVTAPVPQALELLDASQVQLPPATRVRLEQVVYQRCITVLVLLEQPSLLPEPGAVQLQNGPLSWLACNQQKGISQSSAVTLQASPEFSLQNWDQDDAEIIRQLLEAAAPWLGSPVLEVQVHRWRYSQPLQVYGDPFFAVTQPGPLVLCGDGFLSPNLEGAALSGLAAAEYLLRIVNS